MFTTGAKLQEEDGSALYRAWDEKRGPVLVKLLDRRSPPSELDRLKNEFEIGKSLDVPSALKPLALESHDGMPALVMEAFDGVTLDRLLGPPMEIERFLVLAGRITNALAEIHRRNVVHKDLKPSHILVDPASSEVRIVDFGIARELPRHLQAAPSTFVLEGSLPYLSPEQTGRTTRAVDFRSDLYSLGVTFYQMLTGKLPFDAKDLLEWVHSHLARTAPRPSSVVATVPEAVSAIVMKLLSKMPDDRYQTAVGLAHDLERCLHELRWTGRLGTFALGADDISERLQIPHRLYGRDPEKHALESAFNRVATTGAPLVVLVGGPSGAGKTALAFDLRETVARARGAFASAKFDPQKRDAPYATLALAFRELLNELLTESETRVEAFRERIRELVGANAGLLMAVLPELELAIGPQPPVPELPLTEAQGRFRMVLRQLLSAFAEKDHPLVLFLDDLQWADSASLELLVELTTNAPLENLLVIGAHRDETDDLPEATTAALDAIRTGATVESIALGPLSLDDVTRLVADTVHGAIEEVSSLGRLVHAKTAGSPFFAVQFLSTLQREGLVSFDPESGRFRWDVDRIAAHAFTDNLVELMLTKLQNLQGATRDALKYAAFVGRSFDAETLAPICGRPSQQIRDDLQPAVRESLILQQGGEYIFLHDRVREAAQSLVPASERSALHLRIGRIWASAPKETIEERIFDIVHHLCLGAASITSDTERRRYAELHALAAHKAKASAAYSAAVFFLSAARQLLESRDGSIHDDELSWSLDFDLAQCSWLSGDYAAALSLVSRLVPRARDRVAEAAVRKLEVEIYATRGDYFTAFECARTAVASLFGTVIAENASREDSRRGVEALIAEIGDRIDALVELPVMTDPVARAEMDLLSAGLTPGYYVTAHSHEMMVVRMVQLSLQFGNAPDSALGYATLGTTAGRLLHSLGFSARFGEVARLLADRGGGDRPRIYMTLALFVYPRVRTFRECVEFLQTTLDAAVRAGDLTTACTDAMILVSTMLGAGDPLAEVEAGSDRMLELTRGARGAAMHAAIGEVRRLSRALRGLAVDPAQPVPEGPAAWSRAMYEMQRAFYFGDFAAAVASAADARRRLVTVKGLMLNPEFSYFAALSMTMRCDTASPEERETLVKLATEHRERLREWATLVPANYRTRFELVSAELARLEGADSEAARRYEEAIRASREGGLVQNEAMASELASRFYRRRGYALIADAYLREARACYARWGADAKVYALDAEAPRLIERPSRSELASTLAVPTEQLDLLSLMKASQAISSELDFDRLLGALITVVMEQTGARRGAIVLNREGRLVIEAEAALDDQGRPAVELLRSLPVESSSTIPTSLVRWVSRTREKVVLDDASRGSRFAADEALARRKPKSVLALPILRQGEMTGLVYLENDLVAGAFGADRLAALELLAGQAAISLENALLLAAERAAKTAAEQEGRRAALRAEASELFAESLDIATLTDRLARLIVRELADWCVIDLVVDEEIKRIAGAHADPNKQPIIEELRRRFPPCFDSPHAAARVIRSGTPMLFTELTDDDMKKGSVDEAHMELLRKLGTETAISAPLISRRRVLGAISMGSTFARARYGETDVAHVLELAQRAALAIDNALLHRDMQRAIHLRDEFLAAASHELRTPMTSLGLSLQALSRAKGGTIPPDAAKYVTLATNEAGRMNRVVDELLEVTELETGEVALVREKVDLVAIARTTIASHAPDLRRAGSEASLGGATEPVMGWWDGARLERVLGVLLSNAAKFGAGRKIEVTVSARDGLAILAVTDHGIGIDSALRASIFQRFARGVPIEHYGGFGLGLYVARRIVEAHGGSIRVDSERGAGATFTVRLPLGLPT